MTENEKLEAQADYLEEQPLSEEDKELVNKVYDRLEIFENQNRPFHDEVKKCRMIVHMADPDQDTGLVRRKNRKPTLQLQTLKSTMNNVIADQMTSMPEAKLMPETPRLQAMADNLQDIVHHVVYCVNDYEQTHYRRCEDFYVAGTAVTEIAWDPDLCYGKGDIALIRYPLEAFLWDPMAENIQDCRAVMKVAWKPLSWFVEHYPENGKYVTGEKGEHNNVGITAAQENAEHASDEARALLIEYWWRTYDASSNRYSINVAYCAGNCLLEKHMGIYAHGLYPFVLDVHDSIEGSLAGRSLTSELAPMMRYINRYAAYIDTNLRASSKGRMVIRRNSGIDREALSDYENDIIEGDRIVQGEDWNWMQSQPFNSMINQMMLQLETDLKQDSGANQFTRGETTGGIVSGKAINSLIQAGGKVSAMRTEQLKYGFKQIVEQILWLMAQYYKEDRVIAVTGKDGIRKELTIEEGMFGDRTNGVLPPPPYTVQIEISTRDPQRIANQNQMFMEAYTMAAQAQQVFPLSALFRILNLDGKDRILPVIEENEHYQEQLMAAQQQLEQMAAQMQDLQEQNDNLRSGNMELTNAMASMSASTGQGPVQEGKMAEAGGGPGSTSAIVNSARQIQGQELPT